MAAKDGRQQAAEEVAIIREREGLDQRAGQQRRREIIEQYGSVEKWLGQPLDKATSASRPHSTEIGNGNTLNEPTKIDPVSVMEIARDLYDKAGGKDAAMEYIAAFDKLANLNTAAGRPG